MLRYEGVCVCVFKDEGIYVQPVFKNEGVCMCVCSRMRS